MRSPRSSPSHALASSGLRRGLPGRIGTGSHTASSATPRTPGSRRRSGQTCTRLLARRLLADPTRTPAADDSCRPPPRAGLPRVASTGPRRRARAWARRGGRGPARDAGRRAAARDDVPAAIAPLERAAALLTDDSPRRGEVRRELGRGLWEIGESERSLDTLDLAIADATHVGDARAEWLARVDRAAFRLVLGTGDELRDVAERAIEIFAELHDDSALALAWRRMAFVERREGRYGASVEPSARAVEFARVAGDAFEESRAIDSLCTGLLYGPAPAAEARRPLPRAPLGRRRPAGHPGEHPRVAGRARGDARPLRGGALMPTAGRVRSTRSSVCACRSPG